MNPDKKQLLELAHYKMPFGKFKGSFLSDLPEAYFLWFKRNGWPQGKLGVYMQSVYELKINGLEIILKQLRSN
ncbi:putative cytoplasmic protein [Nonlabens tegetincola]|uniref:Putative cytoplasmic protein n=1 Tax=Nonlabens tegetincola TaxID=323273 RepID=A0A090Q8E2_9FLAO|nr:MULTISPECIES: DUF3820 family protein [Nonlabens]ALM20625.1 hypothetical protein AAT17_04925 [Nonlabens sp. MIC269]ARN70322.1 hypothetical protein BST91_00955 [Nonlabens tegetincola]GAK97983.1 putative cytoplasmic protein [Nonlabens tegetincola]